MRHLTLLLLALLVASPPASAGEGDTNSAVPTVEHAPPDAVDTSPKEPVKPPHVILAERIGTPAQLGPVLSILTELDRDDVGAGRSLAFLLGQAGGTAAAEGLLKLTGSSHAQIRRDALLATIKVGLRHPPLLVRIRESARDDKDERVMVAACHALGAIGDGRDVPFLLERMRSEKRRLRIGAYVAMRALSGIRIPNVRARWSDWWEQRGTRATTAIRESIAKLEAGELEPEARKKYTDALLTEAWIDFATVRKALEQWLYAEDRDLRRSACELVGRWRLTDLATAVASAAKTRWARDDVKQASAEALRLLGVPSK